MYYGGIQAFEARHSSHTDIVGKESNQQIANSSSPAKSMALEYTGSELLSGCEPVYNGPVPKNWDQSWKNFKNMSYFQWTGPKKLRPVPEKLLKYVLHCLLKKKKASI